MMNKKSTRFLFLVFYLSAGLWLSSCKVFYPSRMLASGKEYPYHTLPASMATEAYRIAPDDILSIQVSTNDGEKLLDPLQGSVTGIQGDGNLYLVESDSTVNLPLTRRIRLAGMTVREAEKHLEVRLADYFRDPFVRIRVTNQRVIIFPGGMGGTAQVLTLQHPNTSLFEALAQSGGINDGKAYKIKLIRGSDDDRRVYRIDLSSISGLQQGDITLMANDIIYVEPVYRLPQVVLNQVTPYLTLFSTVLIIYSLFR